MKHIRVFVRVEYFFSGRNQENVGLGVGAICYGYDYIGETDWNKREVRKKTRRSLRKGGTKMANDQQQRVVQKCTVVLSEDNQRIARGYYNYSECYHVPVFLFFSNLQRSHHLTPSAILLFFFFVFFSFPFQFVFSFTFHHFSNKTRPYPHVFFFFSCNVIITSRNLLLYSANL